MSQLTDKQQRMAEQRAYTTCTVNRDKGDTWNTNKGFPKLESPWLISVYNAHKHNNHNNYSKCFQAIRVRMLDLHLMLEERERERERERESESESEREQEHIPDPLCQFNVG